MQDIFLIVIGILLGSAGGVCLKIGARLLVGFQWTIDFFISRILTNGFLYLGVIGYFLPAVIWFYLLSKYPLSFLQPILALTYVITPVFAMIFLKESVSFFRWFGILVIISGVYIVSKS